MLKNKITNSVFDNIFYSLYFVVASEESKLSPFRGKWSAGTDRDLYIIFPCFTSPSALAKAPSPHAGKALVEVSVGLIFANGSCVSNILG